METKEISGEGIVVRKAVSLLDMSHYHGAASASWISVAVKCENGEIVCFSGTAGFCMLALTEVGDSVTFVLERKENGGQTLTRFGIVWNSQQ